MSIISKPSLFKILIALAALELILVQAFWFDTFPFSNYPMYSVKPEARLRLVALCDRNSPERLLSSSAFAPLYPSTYYNALSKFLRQGAIEKFAAAKNQLKKNAGIDISTDGFFYDSIWIDVETYRQFVLAESSKDPRPRKLCF